MPEKNRQSDMKARARKRQQVKADTVGNSNYKQNLKQFAQDAKKNGGVDGRLLRLMGINGRGNKPEDRLLKQWRL